MVFGSLAGGMFVTVAANHIENVGKQLYDETIYMNFSIDFPQSAIWLQSALGATVHSNTIAKKGTYKDLTGILTGRSKNCSVHDNIVIECLVRSLFRQKTAGTHQTVRARQQPHPRLDRGKVRRGTRIAITGSYITN
jgi:hypothetical protein